MKWGEAIIDKLVRNCPDVLLYFCIPSLYHSYTAMIRNPYSAAWQRQSGAWVVQATWCTVVEEVQAPEPGESKKFVEWKRKLQENRSGEGLLYDEIASTNWIAAEKQWNHEGKLNWLEGENTMDGRWIRKRSKSWAAKRGPVPKGAKSIRSTTEKGSSKCRGSRIECVISRNLSYTWRPYNLDFTTSARSRDSCHSRHPLQSQWRQRFATRSPERTTSEAQHPAPECITRV